VATTSPDNIWTPDAGDDYALTTDLAAMADTIQEALSDSKNYVPETNALRLARTGSDLFEGLVVWTTDTKILWRYTSGAWVRSLPGQPFAQAAGISPGGSGFITVSFPAGRFTQPPIVTAQIASGSGGAIGATILINGVTTNDFQIRSSVASLPMHWQAVQMTLSSAAG